MKRISRVPQRTSCRQRQPAGFTLVELLVATGLIVLMMSLFAQVFQMAGGSISTQRGIMENDQRSRTLDAIIRKDLSNRTFREVVPFSPGEESANPDFRINLRQGYFYISENDPNDPTDDVLKFTARSTQRIDGLDRYTGRATPITPVPPGSTTWNTTVPGVERFWVVEENQPERDDGSLEPNFTGQSEVAEICFFMRRGTEPGPGNAGRPGCLYRRVMLLRSPPRSYNSQPTSVNPSNPPLFSTGGLYWSQARSFWSDFDYSASYDPIAATGIRFASTADVENGPTGPLPVLSPSFTAGSPAVARFSSGPIAIPHFRFGHDPTNGQPLEFIQNSAGTARSFIGGYTAEETSSSSFRYPQWPGVVGVPPGVITPMSQSRGFATFPASGVIDVVPEYSGGIRRGEDLLLSHVHEFDVKVWDEAVGDWRDVGDATSVPIGDFSQVRNQHYRWDSTPVLVSSFGPCNYGPGASLQTPPLSFADRDAQFANRVFDTWYHSMPYNAQNVVHPAPFVPRRFSWDPNATWGWSGSPTTWQASTLYRRGDMVSISGTAADQYVWVAEPTSGDTGLSGTTNPFSGTPMAPYTPGTIFPITGLPDNQLFWRLVVTDSSSPPPTAGSWRPSIGIGAGWAPNLCTPGDATTPATVVFAPPTVLPQGRNVFYRCIGVRDTTGPTPGVPDGFPDLSSPSPHYGATSRQYNDWPTTPGVEFWEPDGVTGGEVRWRCESNNKPLRAIQIRLRYMDPTTQQMRNQTIVQSLMDFRTTTSTAAAP